MLVFIAPLIACGNCLHFAIWQRFPAIDSWSVIFPIWLLILSGFRTFRGVQVWGVPTLWFAVPMVVFTAMFAPASAGPFLGIWIPICCLTGTLSAWNFSRHSRKRLAISTVLLVGALIGFGIRDAWIQSQMSNEQRARFRPAGERHQKSPSERSGNSGEKFFVIW